MLDTSKFTINGRVVLFEEKFYEGLKKHSNLKKIVQSKVNSICEHPINYGEPLKGNWRGYYSCPVKKHFIIIYTYCKTCRIKGDNAVVGCSDCNIQVEETIRFWHFGIHDKVYADGPP